MTRAILFTPIIGALCVLGACASRPNPGATQKMFADRNEALIKATELAAQAKEKERQGKWPEAVELNRQAVMLNDSLGPAWHNLGVGYMTLQENLKAQECFQRAADLLPTDPKPYETMGLMYFNIGWDEDALRYYELALERDANWLPALRGAVVSAKNLNRSTRTGLDRIKTGRMMEADPGWKKIFDSEYVRVSQDLADEEKRLRKPT